MSAPELALTVQFSAAETIDAPKGVLRGVTVAEIGEATGHFAFLDSSTNKVVAVGGKDDAPAGIITKRVPLCMDAKSIETVVAAGKAAMRVKAREDHDDSVGSRAGFVENFRVEGGKAVCDLSVFESYRNRGVFLETATLTPELIGLSGDFKFNAEVQGDRVLMRVTKVDAVDIVDQGALTHAGLFKANAKTLADLYATEIRFGAKRFPVRFSGEQTLPVDMENKETAQPLHIMAKASEAPDLKAFKALCESVAAYKAANAAAAAEIDEACASLATKAAAPVAPVAPAKEDEMKTAAALKEEVTKEISVTLSALVTTEVTKAVSAAQVEFQKQMSALGIKPAAAAPVVAAPAATTTTEVATDFLTLKASIAKERKVSPVEASRIIMKEKPEVFEAYQTKLGIIKPKKA